MTRSFSRTSLFIAAALSILACRKTSTPTTTTPPPPPPPVAPVVPPLHLTAFTPASAAKDSTVWIAGTGFSDTASVDIVTFNGKPATVTSASDTLLAVKVPATVQDGKITISVNGRADSSAQNFTYVYTVSTFAGSGLYGHVDAQGTAASFGSLLALAIDPSGNLFAADPANKTIRKIAKDATVSTYVSTDPLNAPIQQTTGIAIDLAGNLYLTDAFLSVVQKLTPDGKVANIAGNGTPAYVNGTGIAASFYAPSGIALDANGNLYVGDGLNYCIRKVDPGAAATRYAFTNTDGDKDGTINIAQTSGITDLKMDPAGNIFFAELSGRIRKISPSGVVSTLAGDGIVGLDSTGTPVKFNQPAGIALDAAGNIYVSEIGGYRIRKISLSGLVRTIAGTGAQGNTDGIGPTAAFGRALGVAVDATGAVYVADSYNYKIRRIQ
jgi:hypothetical protein